jgi:putative restriction endonuclease
MLCQPFFFPESEWIPAPKSWAPNIVKGKTFDTSERDGQDLWLAVRARLGGFERTLVEEAEAERYGTRFLTRARLGQGAFRVLVTDAYERRCAISGERTLPVLEAAHIHPYASSGPHWIENGLLLRADLHKLFDEGYLSVSEDHRVRVSRQIRERFENGREYYRYEGEPLAVLPQELVHQPSREFLQWHNDTVFLT